MGSWWDSFPLQSLNGGDGEISMEISSVIEEGEKNGVE